MSYFFDSVEISKFSGKKILHKGRVFNVVDKQNNHKWYSVHVKSTLENGDVLSEYEFCDFKKGTFLNISQEDLNKAIIKKIKI